MTRALCLGTALLFPTLALAGDEPDPAIAQAEAVANEAEALEGRAEWRPASWKWAKAWETNRADASYGLRAGLAAQEAGDCPKSKRLLDQVVVAEGIEKRDLKKANAALAEIEAAGCANVDDETAIEDAKELYGFAEEQSAADNWETAMYAYEDAYFLVPAKVGFAFKVGKAAFEAKRCDKASEYLDHFARYGDPEKHEELLAEADGMQNRLETLGCGQSEAPPPVAKKGCSISPGSSPASLGLLWGLVFLRRRR